MKDIWNTNLFSITLKEYESWWCNTIIKSIWLIGMGVAEFLSPCHTHQNMTYNYWNNYTALFNTTFQLCQIEQILTMVPPFFACEFEIKTKNLINKGNYYQKWKIINLSKTKMKKKAWKEIFSLLWKKAVFPHHKPPKKVV